MVRQHAWNETGADGMVKLWSGETGNRNKREGRGRELSATLLPVLVKCCVLSKRQPRMCQPSRLTLPNGLLNADIKLTRSFALPFSSLTRCLCLCRSLSLPLVLTLSLTVTHLSSASLSLFLLLRISTSHSLSFLFSRGCHSSPSDFSFNYSILTSDALVQVVSVFTTFYGRTHHFCLSFSHQAS